MAPLDPEPLHSGNPEPLWHDLAPLNPEPLHSGNPSAAFIPLTRVPAPLALVAQALQEAGERLKALQDQGEKQRASTAEVQVGGAVGGALPACQQWVGVGWGAQPCQQVGGGGVGGQPANRCLLQLEQLLTPHHDT